MFKINKNKKPFWKKWWIYTLAFIIFIIVIGSVVSQGKPMFRGVERIFYSTPVNIEGYNVDPNAAINIILNNEKVETIKSDEGGNFYFSLNLIEGENIFKANTTTSKGKFKESLIEKINYIIERPEEIEGADLLEDTDNNDNNLNIKGINESEDKNKGKINVDPEEDTNQTQTGEELGEDEEINNDDQTQYYPVVRVVDGDTVVVKIDGVDETLRLIGIDTPETVDPRKPVQCFGIEASNKAKEWLSGKMVELESDPSQDERDKYGRLLRYVRIQEGLFYNLEIIKQGYAHEYTYIIPYKYQTEFKNAEDYARENELGLWHPDACQEDTVAPEEAGNEQEVEDDQPTDQTYNCSENVYNCGDFATRAEAQAVFDYCGGISNDIHRLDSDGDGIVCENLP
jgi:micrococcal nuclease